MESSHFWPSPLHGTLYNTFFDFWFRPPNAQNLLPKICNCKKSPISRLVWQIDRRCLHLPGGFRGWPIQWNHAKCFRADLCCHGNDIWPRRGDLVAYRLVLVCLNCVDQRAALECQNWSHAPARSNLSTSRRGINEVSRVWWQIVINYSSIEIAAESSPQANDPNTSTGQRTDRDVIYDVARCAACETGREIYGFA